MKNGEKIWDIEMGELEWSPNARLWKFTNCSDSQVICISSRKGSDKGSMTQIVAINSRRGQDVFFEILEKKFNEEFYYPKELDETAERIMGLCKTVLKHINESCMISPEKKCAEKLLLEHLSNNVKCIHVYYGNGLFFGMKRKRFNKEEVKKIKSIPMRSRENPLNMP